MKIFPAIFAAFSACVLAVSCSHPTTPPPGPSPTSGAFTVTANIDGTPYSAGASMTIAPIPPNNLVDLKSTSGSRSLELIFILPANATFPVNINQPKFAATYTEGAASYQDSLGSATVTVKSFTKSYADTVFSADFLFKAKGGTSTLTVKNFTAGTVR